MKIVDLEKNLWIAYAAQLGILYPDRMNDKFTGVSQSDLKGMRKMIKAIVKEEIEKGTPVIFPTREGYDHYAMSVLSQNVFCLTIKEMYRFGMFTPKPKVNYAKVAKSTATE